MAVVRKGARHAEPDPGMYIIFVRIEFEEAAERHELIS
jgi:hypothetical protein